MKTNVSVLFYLKKPRNYEAGPMPIYMRITVECNRTELSVGRECDPKRWSSHSGRAIGTKEEYRSLNAYLDSLQTKMYDVHHFLLQTGETITCEALKNKFTGKVEKPKLLIEIFEGHNSNVSALLGNGFEPNTLKGYRTTVNHLKLFIKHKYAAKDVPLTRLDHGFITGFEFYLRSKLKVSAVTAAKYIKNLKKVVNICMAHGWVDKNPFAHYKSTAKAVEKQFLTQDELDAISNKTLKMERLAQVRDIFLFSCYTGLAHADVEKLKRSEIGIGIDREQWVFTNRKKNDSSSRVPLLPVAKRIMDSYEGHPKCDNSGLVLPVLSNQKMNAYLKEIAELCEISKPLTFHIARHTLRPQ
ncbi:site-specific integrase [Hufsiella ginkgonis]|uniref:site-specific integrase n=1 Tax=Hufsiella ginkgonis TaxID=2695274 RepID=UPI001F22A661|nr:site-specific integrase [Hufsiella ginkgonis]